MSTGNGDSLHQHRVSMTDWEHRLRPKPKRHWALWLVLAVLLVFVAYRAGEWPQGAPTQDWLSNERKLARDREFRLRCQ